jgi:signal transduction histidine kinase
MQGEITQGNITRVLIIGFSLVIVLLSVGGSIALRNILSIQQNAAALVRAQRVTRRLIEHLQQEQATLSAIFYTLSGDPDTAEPDTIRKRLVEVESSLKSMEDATRPGPGEQALWGELIQASQAFDVEARRLLDERAAQDLAPAVPDGASDGTPSATSTVGSRELFRRHEQVIRKNSQLVNRGFAEVSGAEDEINRHSTRFNRESLILLCASLLLAVVVSGFTVAMTRTLFRRVAWQEKELASVSWHMLADQESIARRFSHELHDELGQTLAALKSNLALIPQTPLSAGRMADSMRLVDDSIRNVRSLSQLLRPMILDDFGLDAGLSWLCEGFMQRTGIEVDYQSNLHWRLPDETETHLFRIAQEALTNVARHSEATAVKVELEVSGEELRLTILDNGKGLSIVPAGTQSLGMTGMRARARAVGGVFHVTEPDIGGVKLEANIPLPEQILQREANEPHPNFAG